MVFISRAYGKTYVATSRPAHTRSPPILAGVSRPLDGITVLDLTWGLAGPYGAMVLCDLGADVIKVERPPWGDIARTTGPYQNGFSAYFFSVNRGKRSTVINLGTAEGRELFLRLVETVDVVME